ncbi:MAG: CAP domain-containing protein [Desulfocapsaceae bacterium]|nr:CAP domain-containing protein [Desulfocapsaceae bacterium]
MKFLSRSSMLLAGALLLQGVSPGAGAGQPSLDSGGSSGSRIPLAEAGKIVTLHNTIRAEVGVGPVRWSQKLASYAQQWADHLATSRCGMEHRPRSGKWREEYGENLFIGTARHYGTPDAVRAWAAEKSKYHGEALQSSHWADAGHYTQIVWQDTTQIGCAAGSCKGKLIVVCNYDPPGNFLGQKPY